VILHNLPLLGVMLLLIVVGKCATWFAVMKLFRYSQRTSIAVAAGLTQIGELSFILVEVAKKSGLVGEGVFTATLAASLISIFLNVFIVHGVFHWLGPRLFAEKLAAPKRFARVTVLPGSSLRRAPLRRP
jgi:CPA2 family monovalent cation:H+ antiporter-2